MTRSGTIDWSDVRDDPDSGALTLRDDDGRVVDAIAWPEPITASTDSHQVASMFGDWARVDHDGGIIHVSAD